MKSEMNVLDVNGASLRYRVTGSGPPLVFVHNAGSDHHNWDAQVAHFAPTHTVYAVDMLGYGASDPARPQKLELHVEALRQLLESLELEAVRLVGHCVGAAAAWRYASQHPERLGALVLFTPATERTLLAGMFGPLYRAGRRSLLLHKAALASTRATTGLAGVRRLAIGTMFGKGKPPAEYVEHASELWGRPGAMDTLADLLLHFESFAVLDRLERPAVFPRTCLLWGTRNRVLPIRTMEEVRARLAPDSVVVLEGRGHLCMVEAPDEVNAALDAFLT